MNKCSKNEISFVDELLYHYLDEDLKLKMKIELKKINET